MKNIYAIPGAILMIAGLLLIAGFSSYLGQGLNFVGVSNQQTVFDNGNTPILVSLGPFDYYGINFTMKSNDVMAATIHASLKGIDTFVMNQGNFSKFESLNGSTGLVFIYQSEFNVSSASVSFTAPATGNYSLVFGTPQALGADVEVHITITRTVTTETQNYIPYVIVLIGIILLVIGVLSRPKGAGPPAATQKKQISNTQVKSPSKTPTPAKVPSQQTTAPAKVPSQQVVRPPACKYCGAVMSANQIFCPACNKAQL